jgi:hypothetical protein
MSKISAEAIIYRPYFRSKPIFLNSENGPWGWGFVGTKMGSPLFLSEVTAIII